MNWPWTLTVPPQLQPTVAEVENAFKAVEAGIAAEVPVVISLWSRLMGFLGNFIKGLFGAGLSSLSLPAISVIAFAWVALVGAGFLMAKSAYNTHTAYWMTQGAKECRGAVSEEAVRQLKLAYDRKVEETTQMGLRLAQLERDRARDRQEVTQLSSEVAAAYVAIDAAKSTCKRPDAVIDSLNRLIPREASK